MPEIVNDFLIDWGAFRMAGETLLNHMGQPDGHSEKLEYTMMDESDKKPLYKIIIHKYKRRKKPCVFL